MNVIIIEKVGCKNMDDTFEFLEQCELELAKQLCFNCPELTYDQIEDILREYSNEIDRQLMIDDVIVGN